jgi:hypothetical protein
LDSKLKRHLWLLLVVAGFFLLGASPTALDTVDAWGLAFVACTFVGAFMWLRKWKALRWVAASFPFWAMSDAVSWFVYVALGMVYYAMIIGMVRPTLPGRSFRSNEPPLSHLASGPLTPITAQVFPNAHPSRVIQVAAVVMGLLSLVLFVLGAGGWNADLTIALGLSALIIALTFAGANWFSGRVRVRIDSEGLHSRLFYREDSVRWNEIAYLTLRYVFLPGMGARIIYYCVRSPTREFAFPSSMRNAGQLQSAIESATGLKWPEPEITATM